MIDRRLQTPTGTGGYAITVILHRRTKSVQCRLLTGLTDVTKPARKHVGILGTCTPPYCRYRNDESI